MEVLSVDIGGSHVKVLTSSRPHTDERRVESGASMTPDQCIDKIEQLTTGWAFDRITIGFPGPVRDNLIVREPSHLGSGWAGFDFCKAMGKPTRVLNDAAMQAVGSYDDRPMLFLGLGTGLGSALIIDRFVIPTELAHLPRHKHKSFEDFVSESALKDDGKKDWLKHVGQICEEFAHAFPIDEIVLGGGNSTLVEDLPPMTRRGDNKLAFTGGFRMWDEQKPFTVLA